MGYWGSEKHDIVAALVNYEGAASNADSLPTAVAYRGGESLASVMPMTVTNLATGLYNISGVSPGYIGQRRGIYVVLSFTMDGTESHHCFTDLV